MPATQQANGADTAPRDAAARGRARADQASDRTGSRTPAQRRRRAPAIERRVDHRFHPYWGSLLKEENEESSFGAQVEEYACLYTSRVSNFLLYSPAAVLPQPARRDGARVGLTSTRV